MELLLVVTSSPSTEQTNHEGWAGLEPIFYNAQDPNNCVPQYAHLVLQSLGRSPWSIPHLRRGPKMFLNRACRVGSQMTPGTRARSQDRPKEQVGSLERAKEGETRGEGGILERGCPFFNWGPVTFSPRPRVRARA